MIEGVTGYIKFSVRKMKGDRSTVEPACQDMLTDIAMYAQEKYPDFVWDVSPISFWTKVSKMIKS